LELRTWYHFVPKKQVASLVHLFFGKKKYGLLTFLGGGNLIFWDGGGLKAAGETTLRSVARIDDSVNSRGTFLIILLLNERGRFPTTPQLLFPQTFLI